MNFREKLADWLTRGDYSRRSGDAMRAKRQEERAIQFATKAVGLERSLERTERHLRIAESALIKKDEEIAGLLLGDADTEGERS